MSVHLIIRSAETFCSPLWKRGIGLCCGMTNKLSLRSGELGRKMLFTLKKKGGGDLRIFKILIINHQWSSAVCP